MSESIVEVKGIKKSYPGVRALKGIDLSIKSGSVHCIVGENGAGKSTFIKILTGAEPYDSGEMYFDGEEFKPKNIKEAMSKGIGVLYQEINLIDKLTVKENLMLGKEKTKFGILLKEKEDDKALDLLKSFDPSINPNKSAGSLSMAKKQVVEITKALVEKAKVIIMDEPTAAITERETQYLFGIINELKAHNVAVIYISHRLHEIFEIGDFVTVFRDGEIIKTKKVEEVESRQEIVQAMVGKAVHQAYKSRDTVTNEVVLSAKNLTNHLLKDVSFDLHKGEILGFYGLIGSGKTEIARAIYGEDPVVGDISVFGKLVKKLNPRQAISRGIALVPEERRTQGIFGPLNIYDNIIIMNLKSAMSKSVINKKKEREVGKKYIKEMQIATDSMDKQTKFLSGGNQQKVVIAKCINANAKILMLDEPTRGIDVGGKSEIHRKLRELSEKGLSAIVFSSELEEITTLCDRVILLYEGKIKAVLKNNEDINYKQIMSICTGG